jgi:hypothetical protein
MAFSLSLLFQTLVTLSTDEMLQSTTNSMSNDDKLLANFLGNSRKRDKDALLASTGNV